MFFFMALILRKTVAMVGMMGAGKTAIGRAVAEKLDVPFKDTDQEIETAADRTISEIFADHGEAFFRDREHEVLTRLISGPACILSTGGGAYMYERNRQVISEHGIAVWLSASKELLWNRVKHKDTRPLLKTGDPQATLNAIWDERTPVYSLAELSVSAQEEYSIDDMATKVVSSLAKRFDVLSQEPQ